MMANILIYFAKQKEIIQIQNYIQLRIRKQISNRQYSKKPYFKCSDLEKAFDTRIEEQKNN